MATNTFPLLEIEGQPFEMGHQHGLQLKDEITLAFDTFREIVSTDPFGHFTTSPAKPSFEQALSIANQSIPYARRYAPELLDEMQGIAQGSGLTFEEIFALNCWADVIITLTIQADHAVEPGDCSGFAVGGRATVDGQTYVGWNGDDSEWWLQSAVLIKGKPAGGLPFLIWTTAGWVGRPGMNPYLGLSANSLFASDCAPGVPYPLVCRKILQQTSVENAIDVIDGMERMAGMNYTLGDIQGNVAAVETTARRSFEVRGSGSRVVHTNHCTAQSLLPFEARRGKPYYNNTQARLRRLEEQLMETGDKSLSLSDLKAALSDHTGDPYPICRHGGDQPGAAMTLTSLICQLDRSSMLVSYGPPCQKEYVEYVL